jgi:hypothetical protein
MNRILTIGVLLGLGCFWFTPASAIDSKPKQGTTTPAVVPDTTSTHRATGAAKGTDESLLDKLKTDVREAQKSTQPDATDNYIDANNDGIDDRVQEKPKEAPKDNPKGSSTQSGKLRKARPESTHHQVDTNKTTPKSKKRPK